MTHDAHHSPGNDEDKHSLLPSTNGGADEEFAVQTWGTWLGTTANLIVAAVGAGILSFPFAVAHQGIALNIITTVLFAGINAYTNHLLMRHTHLYMPKLRHYTFEELCSVVLGQWAYVGAVLAVLLGCFGALTGFMIVVADLGQPVMYLWTHECCWEFLGTRAFVVLFFSVVVVLPLSFFKRIHSLSGSSVLAVATVVAVAVLVVWRGVASLTTIEPAHVRWFHFSFDMFLSIPIVIFSLGCHLQAVPLYAELHPDEKPRSWRVVVLSSCVCCVLYLSTGVFGYLEFGNGVSGDILAEYKNIDDVAVNVIKLVMVLHVALAYPVVLFPTRRCIDILCHRVGLKKSAEDSVLSTVLQSLFLLSSTCTLAVLVPQVQVVFGLVGATASVAQIYLFPALILFTSESSLRRQQGLTKISRMQVVAVCIFFLGVVVCLLGTGVTVYNNFVLPS